MDTTALKPFAQTMRNDLLAGVRRRLRYWGFSSNGEDNSDDDRDGASPEVEPEPVEGGYIFRGEVHSDPTVPAKWKSLRQAVRRHNVADVAEDAAYTWFNRLLALRILEKGGHTDDVLAYAPGTRQPALLHRARQGIMPFLDSEEQESVKQALLGSDDDAAFRRLLVGYAQDHDLLTGVFGRLGDYTELLLPTGLLADPGGPVHRLVTTGAITDDDYDQVELIGWLYQFYISEKKDAVYDRKGKFRPEDIPAATQIFTPRWIVRYLVENSLGRLWLDKYPDSPLREEMEYLVEGDDNGDAEAFHETSPLFDDLTELQLFDPAAGSGHILVVGFDLLMQMYREKGYSSAEAVRHILAHNLRGLELDRRAAQLARFALLMKAAQHDRRALSRGDLHPEVYAMPEPRRFSSGDLRAYLGSGAFDAVGAEVKAALDLIAEHGPDAGAALELDLSDEARAVVAERVAHWDEKSTNTAAELGFDAELATALRGYLKPLLMLTGAYPAVAMNPPYMGSRQMNADLKGYVKEHYPKSKRDLFAVFMEVGEARTRDGGRLAMINQQSWMFLSSYEKLRTHVLDTQHIESMLHLGPRTFDEISGEVVQSTAFTLRQAPPDGRAGTYYRLVDAPSSNAKRTSFVAREREHAGTRQQDFEKIPGAPVAYWLSSKMIAVFSENEALGSYLSASTGLQTSNNKRFLRQWYEVNEKNLGPVWSHFAKGVDSKWGGKDAFVVNWENDGSQIKEYVVGKYDYLSNPSLVVKNEENYFKRGVICGRIGSSGLIFRLVGTEEIYADATTGFFPKKQDVFYYLGLSNSKILNTVKSLQPTMNTQASDLEKIPVLSSQKRRNKISSHVKGAISTTDRDWNSRETSWDFAQHPLARQETPTLEAAYEAWKQQATQDFLQLHANEEELNRLFIALYGLSGELSARVALDDVTILEDELDRGALEALDAEREDLSKGELRGRLPFLPEVPVRQFLSYGIGVMLGRYRLGKGGLHIAHPGPSDEELAPYDVPVPLAAKEEAAHTEAFEIDDDAILPLMGAGSPFSDDAVLRMREIVRLLWGEDTLTENLNFINRALSEGASRGYVNPKEQTMEGWLVDAFWDYHKSLYSVPYYGKKPIYWLFQSPEGHFQVLVYMHRLDKYTVQRVRQQYLQRHQQHLRRQIETLEGRGEANLSADDAKRLDTLRAAASDCRAYDAILKEVADQQIEIDLDDGVQENYPLFGDAVAPL